MDWLTKALTGICVVLVIGLLLTLHLYGGLKDNYQLLSSQFAEQVAINKDYKSRIQSLHELDTMYTQELTNAKTEIDSLRDAVKSGTKRVYIKAECPKSGADTAAGMDDSRPATLARDAEPDYFDLLGQLETLEKQYLGLRDYVRTECSAK
ncbi:lysis protein [Morganella sp. EGD-HP17]|uniref:lysis protein n=1 Tax=Morganella sp. EGD-HP17 TaxID=1435146 RepID=UPI0004052122|nr:lysis protein [Morganella sp. EGD-HP17]ETO41473.1 lysozyme [Morganella sp. EGD-HP17]